MWRLVMAAVAGAAAAGAGVVGIRGRRPAAAASTCVWAVGCGHGVCELEGGEEHLIMIKSEHSHRSNPTTAPL